LFQQQTALGETGVVGKNNYDVIITNSSIHEQQEISLFNKHTKPSLLQIFNTTSFEHVKWNNWDMGCNDLAISAPYYRAISDRLYKHDQIRKKFLIFDIGANTGQDAANIFGTFHEIEGMCKSYNIPYHLISVEPSPKVFCELNDTAKKKRWPGSHPYHFLNIALSDSTGNLKFADPGNEGGSLVLESSTVDKLGEMNETEFKKAQKCSLQTTTDRSKMILLWFPHTLWIYLYPHSKTSKLLPPLTMCSSSKSILKGMTHRSSRDPVACLIRNALLLFSSKCGLIVKSRK